MFRRLFNTLTLLSLLCLAGVIAIWFRTHHPFVPEMIPEWEEKPTSFEYLATPEEKRLAYIERQTTDVALHCTLDRTFPEVQIENVPLADVIDFIADEVAVPLVVDWKTIEAAGIRRDAPISMKFRNVRFYVALGRTLSSKGLAFVRDGPELRISTPAGLSHVAPIYRSAWPWRSSDDLQAEASLSPFGRGENGNLTPGPPETVRVRADAAFATISQECTVPIDVKWNELRPLGLGPDSLVDATRSSWQASDWLDDILRKASVDHQIQYQFRKGRVIVASRYWFDIQQRATQRIFVGIACMAIVTWVAFFLLIRRRRFLRSPYILTTVLLLYGLGASSAWKASLAPIEWRFADRIFVILAEKPDLMSFTVKPITLGFGRLDSGTFGPPTSQFSFSGFDMTTFGNFGPVTRVTAPCSWLAGIFAGLPACWILIRVMRIATRFRRAAAGRCLSCGYDVRYSRENCPECGSIL